MQKGASNFSLHTLRLQPSLFQIKKNKHDNPKIKKETRNAKKEGGYEQIFRIKFIIKSYIFFLLPFFNPGPTSSDLYVSEGRLENSRVVQQSRLTL